MPIEQSTGVPAKTVWIMENPGLTWGAANILTECGFDFLGRGIYWLRAESYNPQREKIPLFWWKAPNGRQISFTGTSTVTRRAGAGTPKPSGFCNWPACDPRGATPENGLCTDSDVFEKRKAYIEATVARYEAYGNVYPVSSISFWERATTAGSARPTSVSSSTVTMPVRMAESVWSMPDIRISSRPPSGRFARRTSPSQPWRVRLAFAGKNGRDLAGPTAQFREAQRLLRLAEAARRSRRWRAKPTQASPS